MKLLIVDKKNLTVKTIDPRNAGVYFLGRCINDYVLLKVLDGYSITSVIDISEATGSYRNIQKIVDQHFPE